MYLLSISKYLLSHAKMGGIMVRRKRVKTGRRRRKGKPRGMTGRPPTGVRPGERLTDYKQVTVRLPPETVAQLENLSARLARPQWKVMCDAIAVLSRSSD
jgi:hypothetical protein